ncbi:hypothetical protein ACMXYR_14440 [Neptuniibacter sp. QD29_5]|uniref:hypothetical protein n=1 Tax=Neptuniibacter sp. QD29_5 TaxID=3398207 RepID=UPI0039F5EE6B
MSKPLLVRGINGIFDANKVCSVTALKTGVAVANSNNELMYWHPEEDVKKAQLLSDLLSDAVMDRLEGGDGKIDFKEHGFV